MRVEKTDRYQRHVKMTIEVHAILGGDQLQYRDGTRGKVVVRCLPLREVYLPPDSIAAVTYCSTNPPLLYFFLNIKSQQPLVAKTATPLINVTLFIC
jgi:hypothetical protein